MAEIYSDSDLTTAIPDSYFKYRVAQSQSGLATTGVVTLLGEAEEGPSFSEETKLANNVFGPDQFADVQAKYGSGRLVDAFLNASVPANDPDITGAPQLFVLVKTNTGVKASAALAAYTGTYGTLVARSAGTNGNLVQYQVTADTAEVLPTTGSFTYIPAVGTIDASFVSNGVAAATTFAANRSPTQFVSDVSGLAGVIASGGVNRNILAVSGTLTLAAPGSNVITLTRSVAWAVTPTVGDTLVIPTGSVVAGTGDDNVGAYVITAATSTVITATKLSDAGQSGATPGTITAPVAVGAAAIAAVTDAIAYSPVTITLEAGDPLPGVGKSLEVAQASGSGTDLLNRTAFVLGTTTAVSWVSTVSAPALLTGTEYVAKLATSFEPTAYSSSFTAGGDIALKLSYAGTTATFTVTDTTFSTTVTGGAGVSIPSTSLSQYPTINSLVSFLNSKTGYTASAGSGAMGLLPPSALDNVSAAGINSVNTTGTGRFKVDAYSFFAGVRDQAPFVQLGTTPVQADAGLPAPMTAASFLASGAKGATTAANVTSAFTALEKVTTNFVVPLFSQDALGLAGDITLGETDSGSTYTISGVNTALRSHLLAMADIKKKKNRLGAGSIRTTFTAAKEAATTLGTNRIVLAFEDWLSLNSQGVVTQFQPWMHAAVAAGAQAAGGYRSILNKQPNANGAVQAAGDYDSASSTQLEQAIKAGLLPTRVDDDGRFVWASDNTTFGANSTDFVSNSFQAMYAADVVGLTLAQKMKRAFLGQSNADVTSGTALTALDGVMGQLLLSKWIAPSDGGGTAKKGYKDAKVTISGSVLKFSVKVFLAEALKFIKIEFEVNRVQNSAGA